MTALADLSSLEGQVAIVSGGTGVLGGSAQSATGCEEHVGSVAGSGRSAAAPDT